MPHLPAHVQQTVLLTGTQVDVWFIVLHVATQYKTLAMNTLPRPSCAFDPNFYTAPQRHHVTSGWFFGGGVQFGVWLPFAYYIYNIDYIYDTVSRIPKAI